MNNDASEEQIMLNVGLRSSGHLSYIMNWETNLDASEEQIHFCKRIP